MARRFFCVMIAICLFATSAKAQSTWEGATVLPKNLGVKISKTRDNDKSETVAVLDEPSYEVLKEDGDWISVRTRQGTAGWLNKKDAVPLDKAVAYFTERIKKNDDDSEAFNARGWAWRLLGKHDEALKDFGEVIRLAPGAVGYNNRGLTWLEKEQPTKAITDFTEAIRLQPTYHVSYFNRALAWFDRKDYSRAIEDYDIVVALDPANFQAFNNRGYAWKKKKNPDKAIADYTEALRLVPNVPSTLYNRGAAWMDKQEVAKATADLKEVIRLDSQYIYAYSRLGQLAFLEKHYDEALALWQKAIDMDPHYAYPYMRWANFLASCPDGRYRNGAKAIALAKKAIDMEKNSDPLFYEALAAAYAETGDYAQAIHYQQQALESPDLFDMPGARQRLATYERKLPYRQL